QELLLRVAALLLPPFDDVLAGLDRRGAVGGEGGPVRPPFRRGAQKRLGAEGGGQRGQGGYAVGGGPLVGGGGGGPGQRPRGRGGSRSSPPPIPARRAKTPWCRRRRAARSGGYRRRCGATGRGCGRAPSAAPRRPWQARPPPSAAHARWCRSPRDRCPSLAG